MGPFAADPLRRGRHPRRRGDSQGLVHHALALLAGGTGQGGQGGRIEPFPHARHRHAGLLFYREHGDPGPEGRRQPHRFPHRPQGALGSISGNQQMAVGHGSPLRWPPV